jgi:hypothetical protein
VVRATGKLVLSQVGDEQREDFALAGGQLLDLAARGRPVQGQIDEFAVDHRVASVDAVDGVGEDVDVGHAVFEQVAASLRAGFRRVSA